jgi:hypothetical protein
LMASRRQVARWSLSPPGIHAWSRHWKMRKGGDGAFVSGSSAMRSSTSTPTCCA